MTAQPNVLNTYPKRQCRAVSTAVMNTHIKLSRVLGVSALVLGLSACQGVPIATDPVVARPNIPLHFDQGYELYRNAQVPASLAAVRWQTFYTDPKLKTLIRLGLDNNQDIQQAVLAIQKARAQYRISDNRDLPTIGATGGYTRSSQMGYDNGQDIYSVGLGMANYELDFWGKISSLKDEALQNFLATRAAKDTAQVSLIANIAKSYVNLSYQQKQLELALDTLQTRQESLKITQSRFKAGIDSRAPSLQAAASVETARIAAYNARGNVLKARNALKYLIGAPVTDDMLPAPAVPSITSTQVFSAGLPSELLRYRPDILQAEYNLKAAGANIEVARAAYYPTISLSGNLGYRSTDLSDLFKSSAASWSLGPSISLPIFDAGQRDANYEVAQIEQEQLLARYESTIESAFKEVNDVLADKATLDERTQAEYRLQDNYQGLYDISEARYRAQVDDYLSVLDAQRSLFATQQSILSLEQQRLNNQIELYQALGGGANLTDPVTVPTPEHRNLTDILNPTSRQQRTAHVTKVVSTPTVITNSQTYALDADHPMTPQTTVDVENDGNTDAIIDDID